MSQQFDPPAEPAVAAPAMSERRRFLAWPGAAAALLALGCESAPTETEVGDLAGKAGAADGNRQGFRAVNLGKGDTGILNYAYALEQLEAAFYIRVAERFYSGISSAEQTILRDIRDHEITHRDFFAAALGKKAIPTLTFDFSAVDFGSRTSVLTTARTFEDLGVSAYNGAAQLVSNTTILLVAGKIVSVEARHASTIRDLLAPKSGSFAPSAFDPANPPSVVLAAADPFIKNKLLFQNLPTA